MLASIHQPLYLPWLGYIHKVAVSDVHIVLDDVEFDDDSFVKRNRVRTMDGWTWLTVPVHARNDSLIQDVSVANEHRWQKKHWKTLKFSYQKTPHFESHRGFLESVYDSNWSKLLQLNLQILEYLWEAFEVDTRIVLSSDLDVPGKKSEKLANLCQAVDGDAYLSGPNGREYLEEALFREAGIGLAYHTFEHPKYPQAFEGFEPSMSCIDLLFNVGPDARGILMEPNRDRHDILSEAQA